MTKILRLSEASCYSSALEFEALKKLYGGKAAGLMQLYSNGYNIRVPRFYAVPCNATFNQGLVDISGLNRYVLYAVRSGAPVSMPGAMHTSLNVPFDQIQSKVQEVWDSWYSEKAAAYRAANSIPDDLGTGVVIQEMVDPQIAGVAFTADINNPFNKDLFSPKAEYVEGLGEALVSGEVTPTVMDATHCFYPDLMLALKSLHRVYKASDVEWAVDKNGALWVLQIRPLKFNTITFEPVEGCGEVLTIGNSIGAKAQVIGAFTPYPHQSEGKIFWASKFTPDIYPAMMKAKAILCTEGGEFCHAAIVAREMGKPAISGITNLEWLYQHQEIYVDGVTGRIHSVEDNTKVKVVEITKPQEEQDISWRKLYPKMHSIDSEFGIQIHAPRLLYRFYHTVAQYNSGSMTREDRNKVIKELATIIFNYVGLACVGELRHARWRGSITESRVAHSEEAVVLYNRYSELQQFGIVDNKETTERDVYVSGLIDQISNSDTTHILEVMRDVFRGCGWGSAYGGEKWARIVDVLHQFVTGMVAPILFLDNIFNMKHNGGTVFGKFSWVRTGEDVLFQLLNLKVHSDVVEMKKKLEECKAPSRLKTKINGIIYTHQDLEGTNSFLPKPVWEFIENSEEEEGDISVAA